MKMRETIEYALDELQPLETLIPVDQQLTGCLALILYRRFYDAQL